MNTIIHISGPSGSGKTFLGNKLKDTFGSKIVVKDLDELFIEFMEKNKYKWGVKFNPDIYQKYIDNYIDKNKKKVIIFVGLNLDMWHNFYHYYNLSSKYNYYIKIDDKEIVLQKCKRLFNDIPNDEIFMNDLINNNNKFIENITKIINNDCNLKKIIKMNKLFNKDYKKMNYKFMSRENIYKSIFKIINKL
jgi:uridine kinase